ncbi:MAG: hypothetical protein FD180_715 [Planctomycetota bacterium]|nr:MAG: hypothetical protein FD180_715 [Planctomycetota bacterium]
MAKQRNDSPAAIGRPVSQPGIWEAVRDFVPSDRTPLLEECIRAVQNLPGVDAWRPPDPYHLRIIPFDAIRWGLPQTFLKNVPSLRELREAIGSQIGNGLPPKESDLSEANAAALMLALGADKIERIEKDENKTPDFRVWWSADVVELEVTRADRKQTLINCNAAVERLRSEIRSFGRPFDVVIHVADIWNSRDCDQIKISARDCPCGETRGENGRWRVRIVAPNLEGSCDIAGSDHSPGWWAGADGARLFSASQMVGVPDPGSSQPQIRIQYCIPLKAYMNTAANKADHFQGSRKRPFLMALDVTALPGAFESFARDLPEYLMGWPRVSGVILVRGPDLLVGQVIQVGWQWRLFDNDYADNPLPVGMTARIANEPKRKVYELTTGSPT